MNTRDQRQLVTMRPEHARVGTHVQAHARSAAQASLTEESARYQKHSLERLMSELALHARTRSRTPGSDDTEFQACMDQLLASVYKSRDREHALLERIGELESEGRELRREIDALRRVAAHQSRPRQPTAPPPAASSAFRRAHEPVVERRRTTVLDRDLQRQPSDAAAGNPGDDLSPASEDVVAVAPARRRSSSPESLRRQPRHRRSRLWDVLPKLSGVVMTLGAVVGAVGVGLDMDFVLRVGLAVALISGSLMVVLGLPRLIPRLRGVVTGTPAPLR
ncbi:MAG: hypothetical protein K8T26_08100 [Lentisphaerae bacterium]|nr:hypothetical protein [Lentisphaerota bacterium]